MPDDFRISDLPTSADFNNLDLMEISQVDEDSLSGYTSVKKTMNQIGDKLNNSIEYSIDLNTTDKKIIGAINELNAGAVDVTNQVTIAEDITGTNTRFIKKDNVLYIFYQGESKSHAQGDLLFTLPDSLLPMGQIYFLFAINNTCYGNCTLATTGTDKGKVKIAQISTGSTTGRVYFNVSFPVT